MDKNKKLETHDSKEYLTYCEKLNQWDAREYFKSTMREYGAFTSIICGSSKSGKSNLLKYLLVGEPHITKYFDFVLVFSKTLVNGFYQGFLDSQLMFKEYREEVIEDFKKLYEKKKQEKKTFRWLVILDDIVSQKSKYEKSIDDLFFSGRHYGASIVFLSQKVSLMNTGWVANCMVLISLFAGSRAEKNYLAEKIILDAIDIHFSHKKMTEVERIAYLIQSHICQDYNALVILPYEKKEKVFTFRAKLMSKTSKKKATSIFENLIK